MSPGPSPREVEDRFSELEDLEKKVRQAKELIGRLLQSNQKLADELLELKRRLETRADDSGAPKLLPEPARSAELAALRRERERIRNKVSQLIQELESLDI